MHITFRRLFVLFAMTGLLLVTGLASANGWAPTPHLEVHGESRLTLEADRVDIHATFSVEHRDSRLAMQELEQNFGNLLRTLRRQVPEGARLEAGQIRIHPRQTRRNDTWQITGYTASRELKLVNLPVTEAGQWVERITDGKPTQFGPLHYHSSQAADNRNPALEAALQDARDKAELMASSLGQNLGRALQVQEISSPGVQPRMAMMAADSVRMESVTPELEPGLVETSARVRVIFELLN
ncbi:Protein of unknown function [Marinospirillum alkaliphilum DSM 21637]|uniref:SIMPL domain-containing protein n=2 Tax=Marinospirillum TaxID=64968 RepID=A0A1K1WY52_9GAMM|nr:Protein of unknown function [Marinospirillum alkaliphilum DSM 21637]